ncbi:hypothetical protein QWZ13_07435 [Reinekea marina]|nr:hypothetical protein [Reinekea marina]MDN3648746.1 hypothetical protein [Reinekea marina]
MCKIWASHGLARLMDQCRHYTKACCRINYSYKSILLYLYFE